MIADSGAPQEVLIHLSDGTKEILDPTSLYIGAKNVPYCGVRGGEFLARFSRKAYYQLARMVEEDPKEGTFFLRIGPRRFCLRIEPEETCKTSFA